MSEDTDRLLDQKALENELAYCQRLSSSGVVGGAVGVVQSSCQSDVGLRAQEQIRELLACRKKLGSRLDPRCGGFEPIPKGEELLVRGFLGADKKYCGQRQFEFPFQYHLGIKASGEFVVKLNLCFKLDSELKKQQKNWSSILSDWKEAAQKEWHFKEWHSSKTSRGFSFESQIEFQMETPDHACQNFDGIVYLRSGQGRSGYRDWFISDTGFKNETNFFNVRHELGHWLGLIDEYVGGDRKLCHADISSENQESIMGFSGNMNSSFFQQKEWKSKRAVPKLFRQIVSNLVENNYRMGGWVQKIQNAQAVREQEYIPICQELFR